MAVSTAEPVLPELSAVVTAPRRRAFRRCLLAWGRDYGRRDLPWLQRRSPYRVWISEVMLQQTRVETVIPYFRRFVRRFPGIKALAHATEDEVLHLWTGLGYYARARNLQRSARLLWSEHGGRLPRNLERLRRLPGIGRSTAGAILALAHNLPAPILDGNVRRVLTRCFLLRALPDAPLERYLWRLAETLVPEGEAAAYTQAIMDLGATLCTRTRPGCGQCPLQRLCLAKRHGCQQRLPLTRPGPPSPVRKTLFLALRDPSGNLLLERRPPGGVWEGLWCFPECPSTVDGTVDEEEAIAWCRERFGCSRDTVLALPGQRHLFSHYHLHAELSLWGVVRSSPSGAEAGRVLWLYPPAPPPVGLAAVVRRALPVILGSRGGGASRKTVGRKIVGRAAVGQTTIR